MLAATLGSSLSKNIFSGKRTTQAGQGTVRVVQDFYCCLIL